MNSGLTAIEQQHKLTDIRGPGSAAVLRVAGKLLINDPWGMFTVWGGTGSAKSVLLFAVTAALCRRGLPARYYHAGDLQEGFYHDIHNEDSAIGQYYQSLPVLVVDELDKYNFTDWALKKLQTLIDYRYRRAISERDRLTIFATNRDPLAKGSDGKPWLPDDILSRLADGRFNLASDDIALPPELDGVIPGIYNVQGVDMRRGLRREKRAG